MTFADASYVCAYFEKIFSSRDEPFLYVDAGAVVPLKKDASTPFAVASAVVSTVYSHEYVPAVSSFGSASAPTISHGLAFVSSLSRELLDCRPGYALDLSSKRHDDYLSYQSPSRDSLHTIMHIRLCNLPTDVTTVPSYIPYEYSYCRPITYYTSTAYSVCG